MIILKELGEFLKENRQNQGVSIEEAAEDLQTEAIQLENIELGNTRAFKDIYVLKELVKQYAKYLGLDPEKVLDEFNDFLFEHTSKISLDDILEAKKKQEPKEEVKKMTSPYTKERKPRKKIPVKFFVLTGIVVFVVLSFFLIRLVVSREKKVSNELLPDVYEVEELV